MSTYVATAHQIFFFTECLHIVDNPQQRETLIKTDFRLVTTQIYRTLLSNFPFSSY